MEVSSVSEFESILSLPGNSAGKYGEDSIVFICDTINACTFEDKLVSTLNLKVQSVCRFLTLARVDVKEGTLFKCVYEGDTIQGYDGKIAYNTTKAIRSDVDGRYGSGRYGRGVLFKSLNAKLVL